MTCRQLEHSLHEVAEGVATDSTRIAVERHVAGCESCLRSLAELETLLGAMRSMPSRQVSDDFEARLMARVAGDGAKPGLASMWERFRLEFEHRLRVPSMVTAAGLAVAVIAAVAAPGISRRGELAELRRDYVSGAVERHQQLEHVDEELDASLQLSTGVLVE